MSVTGEQVRAWRLETELTQDEVGKLLRRAFPDRKSYDGTQVGRWERGKNTIPRPVQEIFEALMAGAPADDDAPAASRVEPPPEPDDAGGAADSAPAADQLDLPAQTPLPGDSSYAKICAELWQMIAFGVGLGGRAVGSEKAMAAAQVIEADAPALGKAWGKLAEQNDTFRRILISLTQGGAWTEVILVTSTTAVKVYQIASYPAPLPEHAADNGSEPA